MLEASTLPASVTPRCRDIRSFPRSAVGPDHGRHIGGFERELEFRYPRSSRKAMLPSALSTRASAQGPPYFASSSFSRSPS